MLKTFLYVEYSSQEDSSQEDSSQEDSSQEDSSQEDSSQEDLPEDIDDLYAPIMAYKWHTQLQKQWYVVINFASYYIRNNV